MDIRIECPHCQTSYPAARCGIDLAPHQSAQATTVCMVCGKPFDFTIQPLVRVEHPTWFNRVVRRHKPVTIPAGHVVDSLKRE